MLRKQNGQFVTQSAEDRFWRKVNKTKGCWIWTGGISSGGYGSFYIKSPGGFKNTCAHRFAYELLIGPISDGLTIDHLCRVRRCVNPAHLEPVTSRENILRGEGITAREARVTHCPQGHPYSGENLFINSKGSRCCRICQKESDRHQCERRKGKRRNHARNPH